MILETQLFNDYIAVATKVLHKIRMIFLWKVREKIFLFYFSKRDFPCGRKWKLRKEYVFLHIGLYKNYFVKLQFSPSTSMVVGKFWMCFWDWSFSTSWCLHFFHIRLSEDIMLPPFLLFKVLESTFWGVPQGQGPPG
jgi:hypothetical protein